MFSPFSRPTYFYYLFRRPDASTRRLGERARRASLQPPASPRGRIIDILWRFVGRHHGSRCSSDPSRGGADLLRAPDELLPLRPRKGALLIGKSVEGE